MSDMVLANESSPGPAPYWPEDGHRITYVALLYVAEYLSGPERAFPAVQSLHTARLMPVSEAFITPAS